jgi:hypothetical protein
MPSPATGWLSTGDLEPTHPILTASARRDFPHDIATPGAMIRDALGTLPQRDHGEQAPRAAFAKVQAPLACQCGIEC